MKDVVMMKFSFLKHVVIVFFTGAALLLGTSGLTRSQGQNPRPDQSQKKEGEKKQKKEAQEQRQRGGQQSRQVDRQQPPQPRQVDQQQQRASQREPPQARPRPPQQQPQQAEARGQEQQQRIQQQRLNQYNQQRQQQERLAQQREQRLQQQRRQAHLRFQQRYQERLRQDQINLQRARTYEYSAPNYRYSRSGRYYQTNQHGVDMLRKSLNHGYGEGYQAGQADREDRARFSYQESYAYQDATYGYDGYDVDLSEYRYYFREGFNRGYQDGFYSRSRYGNNANGVFSLLGNILEQVFNAQAY